MTCTSWYYSFESHNWLKCIVINYLHSGLHIFKLIDDDTYIINTLDSYRIINEYDEKPSCEELLNEKKWRDAIRIGDSVNFKGDIICITGASTFINGLFNFQDNTYFYKESKQLKEHSKINVNVQNITLDNFYIKTDKNKLQLIKKHNKYTDIKNYYNTLQFYQSNLNNKNYPVQISQQYDAMFVNKSYIIGEDNDELILCDADGFFDIKIYGATYARILCEHKIIPLYYDSNNNIFILQDITITNPILNTYNNALKIQTNGTHYTINEIFFQDHIKKYINDLNTNYSITWFPSFKKALFLGKIFFSKFIVDYDELEKYNKLVENDKLDELIKLDENDESDT